MLLRLVYLAVTHAFALLRLLPMSDRDKDTEILALPHQLMVLERQLGEKVVRFTPSDRAFLAALLHRLPRDVLNLESGHRLLGVGDKHAQLISPPFVWPCPVCRLRVTGLRRACVPEPWTLNDFDFAAQPGVDEKLIRDLATLRFLDDASNVLFVGPPGVCP